MAITICQPLGFTFQGQRENNEDAIFPPSGQATSSQRFFVVCDGVGGAQKGELASMTASTGFAEYFNQYPASQFSITYIQEAFEYVQQKFDQILSMQYLLKGMATTLTLVAISENDITVAHIGDSRIYQIRNGKVVFKSEDHSKVNYLLRAGMITPEQALVHPERNVITRAIQGSHRQTEIETTLLTDIVAGDYFFQCTDGVLENVTDEALCQILDSEQSETDKLQLILNLCEGNTRDNYSGYLVKIESINQQDHNAWVDNAKLMSAESLDQTVDFGGAKSTKKPVADPPSHSIDLGNGLWYLGNS